MRYLVVGGVCALCLGCTSNEPLVSRGDSGAVDRPDEHPELWVDPEAEPEPLPDDDAPDRAPLWVALGVAGVLAALLLVLILVRRL